jgi:transcriptional regulator with XRE-family HTH domain
MPAINLKLLAKNAKAYQITQYILNVSKILLSNVKKMELHDRIKFLRLSKNLTQSYLAEQLNIDTGNYSRLERGETKISIERLGKIAQLLDVDLNFLISKTEPIDDSQNLQNLMLEILSEIKEINKKLK